MNALTTTARQQLGAAIRFHRKQRDWAPRELASGCGASVHDVERWEDGTLVPNGNQWARLKGMAWALKQFGDLYQRAIVEQDAERAQKQNGARMQTNGHVTTNIGAKLTAAIEAPKPAPVVEERKVRRERHAVIPRGSMSAENVSARRDFALNVLRQRPRIAASGADSLHEILMQRFGVGVSPSVVVELREQVQRERAVPASAPPPAVRQSAQVNERDLAAAVELVLGAVPNLRTFTIAVDDRGEADVQYTVREVVVRETGGTLKVRRSEPG